MASTTASSIASKLADDLHKADFTCSTKIEDKQLHLNCGGLFKMDLDAATVDGALGKGVTSVLSTMKLETEIGGRATCDAACVTDMYKAMGGAYASGTGPLKSFAVDATAKFSCAADECKVSVYAPVMNVVMPLSGLSSLGQTSSTADATKVAKSLIATAVMHSALGRKEKADFGTREEWEACEAACVSSHGESYTCVEGAKKGVYATECLPRY